MSNFPTYLDEYDAFVAETAIFPPDKGIQYCVTKLSGEIGEVNEKITQHLHCQYAFTDDFFRHEMERKPLILELGDVTWYCAALLRELKTTIGEAQVWGTWSYVVLPPSVQIMGLGLCLSARVGLINERVGKFIRDKGGDGSNTSYLSDPEFTDKTRADVGAILHIVNALADRFDSDLVSVIGLNVTKLTSRRDRGVLHGSGDNR